MCKNSFICFCYAPSSLELTIIFFHVIFRWTSWSFTPSRFYSHRCLMFICFLWLVLCHLVPLYHFMCKKLKWWNLIVVITIVKDLQAFVAIILFKWTMPCLDLTVMVFFCLFICFSKQWSFEASVVSSFKHLLLLCMHSLNIFHHCFVNSLVFFHCCLFVSASSKN